MKRFPLVVLLCLSTSCAFAQINKWTKLDIKSITTSSNMTCGGNLAVTGTSSFTGALTLTGALGANGGLTVDTSKFTVAGATPWGITHVPAATSTVAHLITATGLTSGDVIQMICDNDALTTGKYINLVGGTGADTTVWSVGEDGAQAITSTVATTTSLGITNNAATTGDLLVLTADDDALTTGGYYIQCLGGTDHATNVLNIAEGGIINLKGDASIDNATSATVLNLTESTVRVTGAFDVTGGLTTDTDALAIADTTGVVTMKSGATIDNNASASILNLTEDTVRVTGALDVTGGLTTDTNAFAIADTTGVITMYGSATINNNADTAVLNLTETTVRATGILDVTGNVTIGGGSGGSGVTITDAGALTVDDASALNGGITVDSTNFTVDGSTGAVTTTGGITATSANATTNATTRAIYGIVNATGTGMTTSHLSTGTRGQVNIGGTTTGQAYFYGAQGKVIPGAFALNGGSWIAGVCAQLDLTAATTYTSTTTQALWADMGASVHANAITGQAQMNIVNLTNTAVGFTPNAIIKSTAYATYAFDLANGDGSTGNFISAGGSDCTASGATDPSYTIKVKIAGVDAYIRCWASP